MTDRNIGVVTEFIEDRPVTPRRDPSGKILELIPGETRVFLKLLLKNTLGVEREVLVEGPQDLSAFFSSAMPEEKGGYQLKVARSVEELADQLRRDLTGVQDDHDRAVEACGMAGYGRPVTEEALQVVVNAALAVAEESLDDR